MPLTANSALVSLYPVIYLDCIVVKVRQHSNVVSKSVYLALGINMDGQKEFLGMWIAQTEGIKFWLSVMTKLKNRGVQDILVACVDGLKAIYQASTEENALKSLELFCDQ